jgi:hypothetical protein
LQSSRGFQLSLSNQLFHKSSKRIVHEPLQSRLFYRLQVFKVYFDHKF